MATGYGPRSRILFDGTAESFTIWETRFTNYIYTLDKTIYKALLPKVTGVDDDADFNDKNRSAYAELVQVIDEKSLQLIMTDCANDGRKAMLALKNHYASTETPRILTLYEQLTTLRMQVNEDITDYIIRAERAANGLRIAGETISDNLIIAMILKGLPELFKPFVIVHTQLDKAKTMTEFKAALHNYAISETNRISDQPPSAVYAMNDTRRFNRNNRTNHQNKPQQCNACGKPNHKSHECRVRSELMCDYCNKPYHVEAVCYQKKNDSKTNPQQHTANTLSNVSSTDSTSTFSFTTSLQTSSDDSANKAGQHAIGKHKLLVDCGATCHIVNNPDRFVKYDTMFNPHQHYIELADGRRSNELAVAKGEAQFEIVDSQGKHHQITLNNALLAPKFPTSLFSVRAATENGAELVFAKNHTRLVANDTVFNIAKEGQLYFLHTANHVDSACTSKTLNEWHTTLGHMNNDDIVRLQAVTRGMNVTKTKAGLSCTTCKESKITKQPKSQDDPPRRATKPLERVHTDLCGPIEPSSKEGYRYVINFIDEHSSMLFVYFLRSKDDASQALKNFLADVAPIGRPLEIHSDNGGEYLSQAFQQVLLDNSIKHTTTAPYSPYQNGKSERTWRSLLEMSRCLLSDAGIPKHFWMYSTRYAQYLRNRSYQQKTNATAYELFTGVQPDMKNIHTFGAQCTIYVEGHKQKLDTRGQDGIFLGINPQNNANFILTPKNNRVLTSRNVIIHEQAVDEESDFSNPLDRTSEQESSEPVVQASVEANERNERPRREPKLPKHLADYHLYTSIDYAYSVIPGIPYTYEEALLSDHSNQWKAAMDAEMNTLLDNNTWEIKPLPDNRTETKGRWVFTIKQGTTIGSVQYKARYVAKGFSQLPGIDYDETFSPTTRFASIRTILQMAANDGLHLHQMDVKGAYLNAPIDKDIYVQQPPGYEQMDIHGKTLTCHLNKSLYGLKQSGRNWHSTLTDFLKSEDFSPNTNDPCVYTRLTADDHQQHILFWVDDIILAGSTITQIEEMKQMLNQRFKMDDRGELKWFLGVDFTRLDDGTYEMCQERYIDSILQRFNMTDCKTASTPADKGIDLTKATDDEHAEFVKHEFPYRAAVGSLIYLMTATRPDISWIVSKLSQYLSKPSLTHVTALKRVLRYVKKTRSYRLAYSPQPGKPLVVYSDSDWANDSEDRRSTTGYIVTLGSSPIIWKTRKQPTVALSSCEAEYMAIAEATKETLYLRSLCSSLGIQQPPTTTVYSDNQSAIALTRNEGGRHNRTKHIDTRYHFIREQSNVSYEYINTEDNLSDNLTKPLALPKLQTAVTRMYLT